ncbi:MAG: DNA polymerase III subunit delta [Paramuribaculum sp.]
MKFSEIPGHETVKQRLRQMALSGKLPHAILLEGPAGVGKMALARAFAQYIHCEHPDPNGDACGRCHSCRLHEAMNHIDTQYVFPVVKTDGMNSNPVSDDFRDQWVEYLKDRIYMDYQGWTALFGKKNAQLLTYVTESSALLHRLSFTSHVSRYKIVVWWLPEKMNEEAANKLLKMIEEPFDDTIFIMVSDRPRDILPTIYSRVQRIPVKRLPDETVARYLCDNYEISEADALAAAHLAEGNVVKAMEVLNQSKETALFFDMFVKLMRLAYQRNVAELRRWSDDLAALGRDCEIRFYDYAMRMVRENFVYNFNVPEISYMTSTEEQFSVRFARFITVDNVERIIRVFDRARTDIAGNANGKIVNLDVTIKIIMLLLPKKQ